MVLGTLLLGKDGNFIVLPFWLLLGAAQWIYIAPLAMLLKRLDRTGIAKGPACCGQAELLALATACV